ncbi:hypothetical protein [Nocardia sp. NPDC004711]
MDQPIHREGEAPATAEPKDFGEGPPTRKQGPGAATQPTEQGPVKRFSINGYEFIDDGTEPEYREEEELAAFEPEAGDEDKRDEDDWDNIP